MDKQSGQLTTLAVTEYNGQMTGLYKPWQSGQTLYPADAPVTSLQLSQETLLLSKGKRVTLQCEAVPYYSNLPEITWSSSDNGVATVSQGVVTAVGEGTASITASTGEITASCTVTAQLETLQHIRIQTIEGSRTVKGINPTVSVRRSIKTLT